MDKRIIMRWWQVPRDGDPRGPRRRGSTGSSTGGSGSTPGSSEQPAGGPACRRRGRPYASGSSAVAWSVLDLDDSAGLSGVVTACGSRRRRPAASSGRGAAASSAASAWSAQRARRARRVGRGPSLGSSVGAGRRARLGARRRGAGVGAGGRRVRRLPVVAAAEPPWSFLHTKPTAAASAADEQQLLELAALLLLPARLDLGDLGGGQVAAGGSSAASLAPPRPPAAGAPPWPRGDGGLLASPRRSRRGLRLASASSGAAFSRASARQRPWPSVAGVLASGRAACGRRADSIVGRAAAVDGSLAVVDRLVDEGLLLAQAHDVALPLVWSVPFDHAARRTRPAPVRRARTSCSARARIGGARGRIERASDVPIHVRGRHG